MGKLAAIAARIIQQVATARKASPIERDEIEDDFYRDPADFAEKYAQHLSEEDRRLLREPI